MVYGAFNCHVMFFHCFEFGDFFNVHVRELHVHLRELHVDSMLQHSCLHMFIWLLRGIVNFSLEMFCDI